MQFSSSLTHVPLFFLQRFITSPRQTRSQISFKHLWLPWSSASNLVLSHGTSCVRGGLDPFYRRGEVGVKTLQSQFADLILKMLLFSSTSEIYKPLRKYCLRNIYFCIICTSTTTFLLHFPGKYCQLVLA